MWLYLHIKDGEDVTEDQDGEHFSTLERARLEAIRAARSIMAEAMRSDMPLNVERAIELTDEAGTVLLTVKFGDAIIW